MRLRRDNYVVKRGGAYLQVREKQIGFHWETTGRAWCRLESYATNFPRTIAIQLAIEHGGVALPVGRRGGVGSTMMVRRTE